MNLKSKAISEIRSTILMLSAHPHNEPHSEFADRIEGLQVLLGELEAEQGGKGVPTEDEITAAMDVAYKKAGDNAYYGNGFRDGAQWLISQMQPEWVAIKLHRLPKSEEYYSIWRKGYSPEETVARLMFHERYNKYCFIDNSMNIYQIGQIVTHYKPLSQPPTK